MCIEFPAPDRSDTAGKLAWISVIVVALAICGVGLLRLELGLVRVDQESKSWAIRFPSWPSADGGCGA